MRIRLIEADEPEQNQAQRNQGQQNQQQQNSQSTQEQSQQSEKDKLADNITRNTKDTKTVENNVSEYLCKLFDVSKHNLPGATQMVVQDTIKDGVIPTESQLKNGQSPTTLQYLYNYYFGKGNKKFPNDQSSLVIFNLLRQNDSGTRKLVKNKDSILYSVRKKENESTEDYLYRLKAALFLSNPNNINRFFDEKPYDKLEEFVNQDASKIKSILHGSQTKSGDDRISIAQWLEDNKTSLSDLVQEVRKITNDDGATKIFEDNSKEIDRKYKNDLSEPLLYRNATMRQVIQKILDIFDRHDLKSFVIPRVDVYQFSSLNNIEKETINDIVANLKKKYSNLEDGNPLKRVFFSYMLDGRDDGLKNALATVYKQKPVLYELRDNFEKLIRERAGVEEQQSNRIEVPQSYPARQR